MLIDHNNKKTELERGHTFLDVIKEVLFQNKLGRLWFIIGMVFLMISLNISSITTIHAQSLSFNSNTTKYISYDAPNSNQSNVNTYLLDKNIKWADGSIERVQIGKDGFFRLNGEKKRLVGFVLQTVWAPYGESGEFYLPENLAVFDKELTYLESIGIRLIHIDLGYVRWWAPSIAQEEAAYRSLLDLIEKHKMLLLPLISGKYIEGFNSLENFDFSWSCSGITDSMGQWATRWIKIVSQYQNVVTVIAENELDQPLSARELPSNYTPVDQKYGPAQVTDFLNYLKNILVSKFDVPVTTKMVGYLKTHPELKSACLKASDIPSFNCYSETVESMNKQIRELISWVAKSGYQPTGWWCTELNNGYPPVVLEQFNANYIDSVFNNGASVAILWPSNLRTDPTWQFFDNSGNPVSKLKEIAGSFAKFQVAFTDPTTTNRIAAAR